MKARKSREYIDDLQAKLTDSFDDLIQTLQYEDPGIDEFGLPILSVDIDRVNVKMKAAQLQALLQEVKKL